MKKLFKREKNFTKDKETFRLNINFYWQLAVLIMFIVIILSSVFGYYLFVQINQESVVSSGGDSPKIETVKKERVEKVLEYFLEREKNSNRILNSLAPIIDPSL